MMSLQLNFFFFSLFVMAIFFVHYVCALQWCTSQSMMYDQKIQIKLCALCYLEFYVVAVAASFLISSWMVSVA